jgi:hypothetical protein
MDTNLPKIVQHTIMTVAREPRLEGDKNPNRANTKGSKLYVKSFTVEVKPNQE